MSLSHKFITYKVNECSTRMELHEYRKKKSHGTLNRGNIFLEWVDMFLRIAFGGFMTSSCKFSKPPVDSLLPYLLTLTLLDGDKVVQVGYHKTFISKNYVLGQLG